MTQTKVPVETSDANNSQCGKIFHSPETVGKSEEIAKYNSLGEYLLKKMQNEFAKETIFTDFESGRSWTGEQLHEKVLNVASALVDKYGIKPGTAACIAYDNCDITAILALALISAGAIVVSSYVKNPYTELLYLAGRAEPKYLFCHEKNRVKWGSQLSQDLGHQVIAIAMDDCQESSTNEDNLKTLMNYDHRKSKAVIPAKIRNLKTQIALIIQTSGTTGHPKLVPVTHWNCLNELVGSVVRKNSTCLCAASLDYVSGRLILFRAISQGYNAVILNGFDTEKFAKAVEKFQISNVFVGAAAFIEFITYPELDKYDLSSINQVFPMGVKMVYLDGLRRFFEKHPNIKRVVQGYGASEFGGICIKYFTPEEYLLDCDNCGQLYSGSSAKIVDTSDGKLLGPNQVGIIHVKTETLFPGYYDKTKAPGSPWNRSCNTEIRTNGNVKKFEGNGNEDHEESSFLRDSSVFDEDGFYISGDLGYFNNKDELSVLGRQKELMLVGSTKKVLPQELEDILAKHPAVSKVTVLGIPTKVSVLPHCPRAFIVPKSEYFANPELIDQLKAIRPKIDTLNDDLDEELEEINELKSSGNKQSALCPLPSVWRCKLANDIMEYMNERVAKYKWLTGGIVLLDKVPTARATGKVDKNYLRSLTSDQVEIHGDQSGWS